MKTKTLHYPANKLVPFILSILMISLILSPSPCLAKTTVTVQIAYGGAICGGLGLFVYFYRSLGSGLWSPGITPAILQVRSGRIIWGIPAIECARPLSGVPSNPSVGSYYVSFLRWEF
jgi:hypothetical protein